MSYAIVLGSAPGVGVDFGGAVSLLGDRPYIVYAVNRAGVYAPRVDVWASLHPENFKGWLGERVSFGKSLPGELLDLLQREDAYRFDGLPEQEHGTSGLACVKAALDRGYDKIILCGIPMDGTLGHFDNPAYWDTGDRCLKYWHIAAKFSPALRDRVRSMSGNTRLLLGEPTRAWLR